MRPRRGVFFSTAGETTLHPPRRRDQKNDRGTQSLRVLATTTRPWGRRPPDPQALVATARVGLAPTPRPIHCGRDFTEAISARREQDEPKHAERDDANVAAASRTCKLARERLSSPRRSHPTRNRTNVHTTPALTHRARARRLAMSLDPAEQRVLVSMGGVVRGAILDRLVGRGLLIRTNWNNWTRTPLGETVRKELLP